MQKSDKLCHVCPSVQMEQLCYHWMDFIWSLIFKYFKKSVKKIQVSLKSGKNNGYFTWKPLHFLSYLSQKKSCRENQHTHFMFSNFFLKYRAVCDIMGKIWLSQTCHRWQYGVCILHAGYLRLQTHTLGICSTNCSHCNSGCTNAPQCYVIRTLPVLFLFMYSSWALLQKSSFPQKNS